MCIHFARLLLTKPVSKRKLPIANTSNQTPWDVGVHTPNHEESEASEPGEHKETAFFDISYQKRVDVEDDIGQHC